MKSLALSLSEWLQGKCVPAVLLAVIVCGGIEAAGQSRAKSRQKQSAQTMKAEEVREAKQRLSALGYWTGPIDEVFDEGSRHALIAFQKVEGRARTGKLTAEELESLRAAKRPAPRASDSAHIEIDLSRQVLFVVDESGEVSNILPISTGTGKLFTSQGWTRRACTPCGEFTVYRKIAGWRKSPLGLLYYPNYISGGVAIHGSLSVPAHPASHGCIRIPLFAAKAFSEMIPIGARVIVYYDLDEKP